MLHRLFQGDEEQANQAATSAATAKLSRVCGELISTEETYVATLATMCEVFLRPLRTWSAEGAEADIALGASPDEIHNLFGHVETLYKVNSKLLGELQQARRDVQAEEDARDRVARPEAARLAIALSRKLAEAAGGPLKLYTPHVTAFASVPSRLAKLRATRATFTATVRVLELQPRTNGLTLQALLVNTVQRLPRYTLLLHEMLQQATVLRDGTALDELEETIGKIKGVIEGLNSRVGEEERRKRAAEVARDTLRRDDLVASHRELVREGALTKLRPGRTFEKNVHRSRRRAFIFSDLLVLFSQQHASVRVYPLQSLILVAPDLVYCAESGPKHQQSLELFEQAHAPHRTAQPRATPTHAPAAPADSTRHARRPSRAGGAAGRRGGARALGGRPRRLLLRRRPRGRRGRRAAGGGRAPARGRRRGAARVGARRARLPQLVMASSRAPSAHGR